MVVFYTSLFNKNLRLPIPIDFLAYIPNPLRVAYNGRICELFFGLAGEVTPPSLPTYPKTNKLDCQKSVELGVVWGKLTDEFAFNVRIRLRRPN